MALSELVDQIDQAALDGDVTRALLLCQKLADRADSEELRSWAERELVGYPQSDDMPEYRSAKCTMVGDSVAGPERLAGVPIPPDLLKREDGALGFFEAKFRFTIAEVQQMSQSDDVVTFISEHTVTMTQLVNEAN